HVPDHYSLVWCFHGQQLARWRPRWRLLTVPVPPLAVHPCSSTEIRCNLCSFGIHQNHAAIERNRQHSPVRRIAEATRKEPRKLHALQEPTSCCAPDGELIRDVDPTRPVRSNPCDESTIRTEGSHPRIVLDLQIQRFGLAVRQIEKDEGAAPLVEM